MINGLDAIGAIDFAADPDETPELVDNLYARIARGEDVEFIFFARIFTRPVDKTQDDIDEFGSIASLAFGEESNELFGVEPDDVLLLSDAEWCGRPDDFGAADLEAEVRLISPGDQQQRIAYFPEEERRGVNVTGAMTASNADGFFSTWQHQRSVVGSTVHHYIGEARGKSADWIRYATTRIESLSVDRDEATFNLETFEFLLDVPVLQETFAGTGGSAGDPRLAGRPIPLALGNLSTFANTPCLFESEADLIIRHSAGAIQDVLGVRDSAVPLSWDGNDWPDYVSLRNAVVAPGFFTKARAIGRSKLGAEPAGVVTADLLGSTLFTGYSAQSKDIVDFLVAGIAGVPSGFWNAASAGVLPAGPVGLYLDGATNPLASEVLDLFLRPFNAHLLTQTDGRLAVGLATPKAAGVFDFQLEAGDFYDLDDREFEERPRFEQQVTYREVFRPMTPEEMVRPSDNPAVTEQAYAALQTEYLVATEGDVRIRQQHRDALGRMDLEPVRTLFRHKHDAQNAAALIMSLLGRSNMKPGAEVGMAGLLAANGLTVQMTAPELDFDRGRPGLVVERNLNGAERSFEIIAIAERTNV